MVVVGERFQVIGDGGVGLTLLWKVSSLGSSSCLVVVGDADCSWGEGGGQDEVVEEVAHAEGLLVMKVLHGEGSDGACHHCGGCIAVMEAIDWCFTMRERGD